MQDGVLRKGTPDHGGYTNIFGMSPSGKARGFDLRTRRFESYHPSHLPET